MGLREELLVYMGQLRLHKKVKPLRLVKCLQAAKCRYVTVNPLCSNFFFNCLLIYIYFLKLFFCSYLFMAM